MLFKAQIVFLYSRRNFAFLAGLFFEGLKVLLVDAFLGEAGILG